MARAEVPGQGAEARRGQGRRARLALHGRDDAPAAPPGDPRRHAPPRPDKDRLIGIFQTPNVGIETSVSELRRAKKEGYKGVAISAWPSGGDNLRAEDDPFWQTAAELDMPVSIHLLLAAQQQKMGASNKG